MLSSVLSFGRSAHELVLCLSCLEGRHREIPGVEEPRLPEKLLVLTVLWGFVLVGFVLFFLNLCLMQVVVFKACNVPLCLLQSEFVVSFCFTSTFWLFTGPFPYCPSSQAWGSSKASRGAAQRRWLPQALLMQQRSCCSLSLSSPCL